MCGMAGRATVMNLFRVPLNFIVIIILTQVRARSQHDITQRIYQVSFSRLLIDYRVIFLPF